MTSVPISVEPLGEQGGSGLDLTFPLGVLGTPANRRALPHLAAGLAKGQSLLSHRHPFRVCHHSPHLLELLWSCEELAEFYILQNESWLVNKSVFHHQLEMDSYPRVLALDLIFLRESAKPFSPGRRCPSFVQLPLHCG